MEHVLEIKFKGSIDKQLLNQLVENSLTYSISDDDSSLLLVSDQIYVNYLRNQLDLDQISQIQIKPVEQVELAQETSSTNISRYSIAI